MNYNTPHYKNKDIFINYYLLDPLGFTPRKQAATAPCRRAPVGTPPVYIFIDFSAAGLLRSRLYARQVKRRDILLAGA